MTQERKDVTEQSTMEALVARVAVLEQLVASMAKSITTGQLVIRGEDGRPVATLGPAGKLPVELALGNGRDEPAFSIGVYGNGACLWMADREGGTASISGREEEAGGPYLQLTDRQGGFRIGPEGVEVVRYPEAIEK